MWLACTAGTVYVDVVPSMGFWPRSSCRWLATPGKKYAEKIQEQVSASGKAIVDAIADHQSPRRGCARRPPRPGRHVRGARQGRKSGLGARESARRRGDRGDCGER